jgi:hypothetical protein
VRDTPFGPTLNLARPIAIREDTCLTCHSTPSVAPAALTRSYGSANILLRDSRRAAITAKQFCSFSLGENLSGCNGISKTAEWKKCER